MYQKDSPLQTCQENWNRLSGIFGRIIPKSLKLVYDYLGTNNLTWKGGGGGRKLFISNNSKYMKMARCISWLSQWDTKKIEILTFNLNCKATILNLNPPFQ